MGVTPASVLEQRRVEIDGVPGDLPTVAPASEEEMAAVMAHATERALPVAIWGGGTHRSIGNESSPRLAVGTGALDTIMAWEPDDLTVVVGAGMTVDALEAALAERGQTAVLPERAAGATVGGVVAAAVSPYRRLRYGPTRDRLLEVRAVTGDGRIVKGGGRVVKNVSGYDLPRLYTGSLGSLGCITSVCLKLWPLTETAATVRCDDIERVGIVHRPLAVLETRKEVSVLLAGTKAEVDDQARRLGGEMAAGLGYPQPPQGRMTWSIRVRPRHLADAVARLPPGADFVAQHGVGEATFGIDDESHVPQLREWAEQVGGAVVRLSGAGAVDPWGTPPTALELQRRVVAAFDPGRILERGRLPGGI